jgi:hypothetical protein
MTVVTMRQWGACPNSYTSVQNTTRYHHTHKVDELVSRNPLIFSYLIFFHCKCSQNPSGKFSIYRANIKAAEGCGVRKCSQLAAAAEVATTKK